jgi:serine/threonine-protein kinase
VDRFILGPELGRGGMGVVNLAWDPLLRRQVAFKRLLHADPMQAIRFLREAQVQAKVDHPRVCEIFEVGAGADTPYIAMRLVLGPTLGEARETLPLPELVRIMTEIAGAVAEAHRKALIHRDLKPTNILLEQDPDGIWHPCILDFGLARDLASADVTLSWGLVGTPAFMSPEQARGEELGPASDIYSLGATFFALLTSVPPYEATTLVGLLQQHAAERPPSLNRRAPHVPRDLRTIVETCLEADARRRYHSATELEADLRRYQEGLPIQARPPSPLGKLWRSLKRHRAASLVTAGGVLLSAAFLGWTLHAAALSRRQVAVAQRFGSQVRELEQILRLERMLPAHDMRPVEGRIRTAMTRIRESLEQLGPEAEGPARYALGRGHLLLGEFDPARKELESAWKLGYRSSETAEALAWVLVEQFFGVYPTRGDLPKSRLAEFRRTYAEPAMAYLRQVEGGALVAPEFAQGQIALMLGDFARCRSLCAQVLTQRPWFHEAYLLESLAWRSEAFFHLGLNAESDAAPARARECLEACGKALDAALRIAPSDVRIHTGILNRIGLLSVLDADSGAPDLHLFQLAEEAHQQAFKIRPDDRGLFNSLDYHRTRWGLMQLRVGQDARPLVRDTLARIDQWWGDNKDEDSRMQRACHCWILADAQWRRGEDPRPAIAEIERVFDLRPWIFSEYLLPLAEYQVQRGLDPKPTFDRMAEGLMPTDQAREKDFYRQVIWAKGLILHADWEAEQGRDPMPLLTRAADHLDRGLACNPKAVYSWFFRAMVRTRVGRWRQAKGGSGEAEFRRALDDTRRALAIADSHWNTHFAKGEAHLALAESAANPAPELAAARAEVAAGLKLNATDFRLHRLGARVELAWAELERRAGRPADGALDRADAAARNGLDFKADDPKLWILRARALRLRRDALARTQEAAKYLERARNLNPRLAELAAELAALDLLRTQGAEGSQALEACLARHPLLAVDYRREEKATTSTR